MKRITFFLLALVMVALALASAPPAAADDALPALEVHNSPNGVYIVELADKPVVAYEGDIAGLPATKPGNGEKIDVRNRDVVRYVGYLKDKHNEVAQRARANKIYDYAYTFNGFAAEMSATEAAKLAASKDVVAVTPDELYEVDTSSTYSFLGLDAEGGLWELLGGIGMGGEDIVIGIVDSGIWPENNSFADRVNVFGFPSGRGFKVYQQIPGWNAKCTPGEMFNASMCNHKLIGAQWFNAAWGGDEALEAARPWEFMSPRDYNGHGSHTAGTAGGNWNTVTTGPAAAFGNVSGMAPRARISAYKALWSAEDGSTASGFTTDLVAAIDQAVADGVDVINYSISGSRTDFLNPVMVSYLFAADAGVFVAASAGNSGPGAATVAHPGPWVTTVAAGTHDRSMEGTVTLGDGSVYTGASSATESVSGSFVYAGDVGLAGADPTEVELCYPGTLDPALVTGKIVLCDRGIIARVDKSLAVYMAGGIGSVLRNVSAASLNADFHSVPTVHVDHIDGLAIYNYIMLEGAAATATISEGTANFDAPAPFTASFSSRGPLQAGAGDLLKPDVIAPGVDILAAVAPPANSGMSFNLYSGTSMSSPHVAGLAALLMDKHPDWSPMAIKSALMTTGYDVLDVTSTANRIFRQGAGHVDPNKAADPGLVFDSGWNDWLAFLCGTGQLQASYCPIIAIDPSDFNVASIAIGALGGEQTVTRAVTNVGPSGTYHTSVEGLEGLDVTVEPNIHVNAGETVEFEVTFTANDDAVMNAYTGGFLTLTHAHHVVRIPVVVRPVALGAPAEVFGTGDPIAYEVVFGYTGDFFTEGRGLIPAITIDGYVEDDPTDTFAPFGPGTTLHMVNVPAGSTYARFSLFDDFTDGDDDLDLYVFYPTGAYAGGSGSGTSAEEVNVLNPIAGDYYVFVHGWGTDGPDANYTLFSWALGTADAGNMTVNAPATATVGGTGTITLEFANLDPATKYLGSVAYSGADGMPNPTIVRVDTP
jgi:subtilisin family serine protease